MHEAFLERWVAGWAASRKLPIRRDGDAWHVRVGSETRHEEYFVAEPSATEALRLTNLVALRSTSWLTVAGAVEHGVLAAFGALDRLARVETLMDAPLGSTTMPEDVRVDADGDVAHVRIEVDGVLAARGQVAVRGGDAVVDRIETVEGFRRRGLGRRVVEGLSAWAAERGADTGLLLASEQGRALYRSMGWRDVAPAVTYRGVV